MNSLFYCHVLLLCLPRPLHEQLYALLLIINDIVDTQGQQACTKAVVFAQMMNDGFFPGNNIDQFETLLLDATMRNMVQVGDEGEGLAVIWVKLRRVDGRFV